MITGMIRVKNGAKWIHESVTSLLSACDRVAVLDNTSEDNTYNIVNRIHGASVFRNPHDDLNEARDKTLLVRAIKAYYPDTEWVVCVDADEILLDPRQLANTLLVGRAPAYSLHILSLWDRTDQIRVDGIYGDLWRPSVFNLRATNGVWVERNPAGPNLHCGSVPTDLVSRAIRARVRLKHYGPMEREDRIRKYKWYLTTDNANLENEDYYRHSVQGDLPEFPAEAVYRHGGPLKLVPWEGK